MGKTEGILTLIRGVPYNASKLGKVYIPINLLADYKVSSESILRKNYEKENLQKLVEALASIAEDHLSNSRFRAKYLTKEEKQILLPAITADRYMTRVSMFLIHEIFSIDKGSLVVIFLITLKIYLIVFSFN